MYAQQQKAKNDINSRISPPPSLEALLAILGYKSSWVADLTIFFSSCELRISIEVTVSFAQKSRAVHWPERVLNKYLYTNQNATDGFFTLLKF